MHFALARNVENVMTKKGFLGRALIKDLRYTCFLAKKLPFFDDFICRYHKTIRKWRGRQVLISKYLSISPHLLFCVHDFSVKLKLRTLPLSPNL